VVVVNLLGCSLMEIGSSHLDRWCCQSCLFWLWLPMV